MTISSFQLGMVNWQVGWVGKGRMAEPKEIASFLKKNIRISSEQDFVGKKF